MRAPWVLVAVLTAVSPSTRAGVWDPPPVACEGTDEVAPGSSMEAWGLLDDCLAETGAHREEPVARWARDCRCAALARWLILWGDRSDLERAWSLYDNLGGDHTLGLRVLDDMLDRAVADAIEQWERRALEDHGSEPAAACPGESTAPPLPTWLREAPPDLKEAAHLFANIRHAGTAQVPPASSAPRMAFQGHEEAFRKTVVDFLRGRRSASSSVQDLARYHWDHWCGTGSFWFRRTRTRALIAAWLRLGEPRRAACSAFGQLHWDEGLDEILEGWERRLLEAAGVDWEAFFVGGLLDSSLADGPALGRHGSERTALLLLEVLNLPGLRRQRPACYREAIRALATMVRPGQCVGDVAARQLGPPRAEDAPLILPDLEERILDGLASSALSRQGVTESRDAAELLVGLCRPESQAAFDRMRRSSFFRVRRLGTRGLRFLGHRVPDARPAAPVAFQVLIDRNPLAGALVQWMHRAAGTTRTDERGVMYLDRDWFLDPSDPVMNEVEFRAPMLSSAEEVWFAVRVPRPGDLDAVTTVEISTGRLTIVVPEWALPGRDAGTSPILTLFGPYPAVGGGGRPMGTPARVSDSFPVSTTHVTFPHVMEGVYATVMALRDGTILSTGRVTVGGTPVLAELRQVPRP